MRIEGWASAVEKGFVFDLKYRSQMQKAEIRSKKCVIRQMLTVCPSRPVSAHSNSFGLQI